MRTHRNRISVMQRPKPEKPIVGSEATGTLTSSDGSTYRWHQCFRDSGAVKGSGEINRDRGWYCRSCGCPADLGFGDDVPDCCSKCGSCEPFRFEEGT
jgi:hypothetical protein